MTNHTITAPRARAPGPDTFSSQESGPVCDGTTPFANRRRFGHRRHVGALVAQVEPVGCGTAPWANPGLFKAPATGRMR
jgi:hypothetical protein